MKNKSMVAVLVPTFMPASYIEGCLQSLERQSLSKDNFKVYIALNGPEEPYKEYVYSLLQACSFEWVVLYTDETGVSNARNYLIDVSCEPYICFVDDDDILSENYLESLLACANEAALAVSNVKVFDVDIESAKENYIGNSFLRMGCAETSLYKVRQYFSSPCAKLIHRGLIGDVRFDVNLHKGEDALFMAMISPKVQEVKKVFPESCYYVFRRPGSASRKKVSKKGELLRILYLLKRYSCMLFGSGYDKKFILSRMAATLVHARKLLL